MHQHRSRLGLRPRPRWGSLQRSARPPSWIKGGLLLMEREGIWEGRGRGGKGGEDRGGTGRGGEGRRREGTLPIFYCTPQFQFSRNMPASNDDLTRTTKRQNTYQRKLTIHKRGPNKQKDAQYRNKWRRRIKG